MNNTTIWLIGVPVEQSVVGRIDLTRLMTRALKTEQRLKTGVRLEDMRNLYHILSDRIEFVTHKIWLERDLAYCRLSPDYLELLLMLKDKFPDETGLTRVMASFCPVDQLNQEISSFEQLVQQAGVDHLDDVRNRLDFYRQAESNFWHVIELHQSSAGALSLGQRQGDGDTESNFWSLEVSDSVANAVMGKQSNKAVLHQRFCDAIALQNQGKPAAVNFGGVPNNAITEVLNTYVYSSGTAMEIQVSYADGSKARPFPIYCLSHREVSSTEPIDVGMMSVRHSELDKQVKLFWYRNQEISVSRTSAETDEIAYRKSVEMFTQMRSENAYTLRFYQTGFEPAVVGFYRALTEELLYRRQNDLPDLEVIPMHYTKTDGKDDYIPGECWN